MLAQTGHLGLIPPVADLRAVGLLCSKPKVVHLDGDGLLLPVALICVQADLDRDFAAGTLVSEP